jgi:hypothetical protein
MVVFNTFEAATKFIVASKFMPYYNGDVILPCEYIPSDNIPSWSRDINIPEATRFTRAVRIF